MQVRVPGDLNIRARQLIDRLGGNKLDAMDIQVVSGPLGSVLLDFATNRIGTLAGGLVLSEICMSGLGAVELTPSTHSSWPFPLVRVQTDHPLAACIASQYAGWPLNVTNYFAMASGPARMLRGREEILTKFNLSENSSQAVVVLECNQMPSAEAIEQIGLDCQLSPADVTVCVARTSSLPGTIQIVSRCIETTLHKLFELQFDLASIVSAFGTAPLPPIGVDDLQSIGWTNDSIIFGADVTLWTNCEDSDIESIGSRVPSCESKDFGRPFVEIFESYDRDFYRIDKLLFSPARVTFNNIRSGRSFEFGSVHFKLLRNAVGFRD